MVSTFDLYVKGLYIFNKKKARKHCFRVKITIGSFFSESIEAYSFILSVLHILVMFSFVLIKHLSRQLTAELTAQRVKVFRTFSGLLGSPLVLVYLYCFVLALIFFHLEFSPTIFKNIYFYINILTVLTLWNFVSYIDKCHTMQIYLHANLSGVDLFIV